MDWRIATGIICCFGVFKDFRPSESYITAYLMAPEWKNLTIEQVNNEIYPVWTYSYLTMLVVVLLLTDLLRYKIVIIFEALSYMTTWIILLWGHGVILMQLMQFTFGCATSMEIAYYSYVYAAISDAHYRKVSSFIRASSLTGRFIAALLAQLLLTFGGVSFFFLNVISFGNVCISFVIALMLPSIKSSFYFEIDFELETGKTSSFTCTKPGNEMEVMFSKDAVEFTKVEEKEKGNKMVEMFSKDDTEFTKVEEKNTDAEDDIEEFDEKQLIVSKEETRILESKESAVSVSKHGDEEDVCPSRQESKIMLDKKIHQMLNVIVVPTKTNTEHQTKRNCRIFNKKSLHLLCQNLVDIVFIKEGFHRMWIDFQKAYKNRKLCLWSFWWATTTCGKVHLGNYIQSLYEVIRVDYNTATNYNAAVDASSLAICAATSFGIGFVKVNWSKYGELLLFSVNLIIGGLMLWMSFTNSIWIAYGCYLIIRIIFQTVLTIATYQVAVHLSSRCYGLVFGLNTFMALLLETIMTVIVVDKHGLNLDVRTQFAVYGGYFGVLSLPFLVKFFYNCFRKKNELQLKSVNVLEEPSK